MKKENPQRRKVGRKPKAKPERYRYVVRMDEDENRQFKLMFQKSEAVHHSKFIKSVLLNRTIKIIKIDPATTDFYIRLTNFYHQFQAIGNNYNQVVKAVKTNFGDKRAFVLLRKLEKETVELVIVSRQIVALINEYKERYLNTHLPD
ncbi:MAG TPA: conjugal transfer protein MobA [Alloprevotella sp.]|nr:conjugal transfer protein MobA [Alloprevotella sp.]